MTVRHTSKAAYDNLVTNNWLPVRRRQVYAHVYNNGPCTALQIEKGIGSKHANKRTSELREMGLLKEVGEVDCPITGHVAILWDVTDLEVPRPFVAAPKRVSRKALEKELVALRAENHRLTLGASTTLAVPPARAREVGITRERAMDVMRELIAGVETQGRNGAESSLSVAVNSEELIQACFVALWDMGECVTT